MNRRIFIGGLVGVTVGCRAASDSKLPQPGVATKGMGLTSTAFEANGVIPAKYTCDGENLSPLLQWDAPPEGTQSLALIVDDPDAPTGTFLHWMIYNLPAALRQLPEGVSPQPRRSEGGIQVNNDFGKLGYGGPCPPGGTHRYVFQLYALDLVLNPAQVTTRNQLLAAMQGHVLVWGELVGRYGRKGGG